MIEETLPVTKNNIKIINDFLSTEKDHTLLINKVSEEIACFYDFVVKEFSEKYKIKVYTNNEPSSTNDVDDLFLNNKIDIYNLANSKLIESLGNEDYKKIIFSDYKNYKKFQKQFLTVNGYEFERDMNYFIRIINEINEDSLVEYCTSKPYFTSSEISKYKISKSNYITDSNIKEFRNFILDIRKEVYMSRKSKFDVKKLFLMIKNEALYKKFSFLIY